MGIGATLVFMFVFVFGLVLFYSTVYIRVKNFWAEQFLLLAMTITMALPFYILAKNMLLNVPIVLLPKEASEYLTFVGPLFIGVVLVLILKAFVLEPRKAQLK